MEDKDFENKLLKADYEASEQENAELKAENERLKRENEILLGQLVINDGEDVTVQISKSQFDEYNKFRTCLQEIKKLAEVGQDKYHNGLIVAKPILDLITKAESEG